MPARDRCSLAVAAAVATRDRSGGVARCVDALLAGTVLPGEIIVVDQSVTDATQALFTAFGDSRLLAVRYLRQSTPGLSASRNAAIRLTRFPVLAMTDDDCVPDANWIDAIEHAFEAAPHVAAVTGRVLPLGDQQPGLHAVSLRTQETAREYAGRAIPWLVGSGGSTAVKVDWCRRVGGFDERLGAGSPGRAAEDADMLYRLLREGATIRYDPAAVVFHQRQTWAARLASRNNYGHGIGAFTGIWLRRHDGFAGRCFAGWVGAQAMKCVDAIAHRDWALARQRQLSLTGALHGLAYGLRVRAGSRTRT